MSAQAQSDVGADPTSADDAEDEFSAEPNGRDAEGRALFQAGQVAFEAARFEDALRHFRAAYDLSGRPQLLYNIGIVEDRLRNDAAALEALEEFVERVPDDTPRYADAVARIAVLRESVVRATETRPDEVPSTGSSSAGPWVLVIAGSATAVGGGLVAIFGGLANSRVSGAEEGTAWSAVQGDAARGPRLVGAGLALVGVGAALAIAGLTWKLVGRDDRSATLGVGPGGLSLRGTF